jgi:ankyrin repeat protein
MKSHDVISHLYEACKTGDLRAVRQAYVSGVDMNQILTHFHDPPSTALLLASQKTHLPVMQFLLQIGVNVDQTASTASFDHINDDTWTPLLWSIRRGDANGAQLILQCGANVHLMDSHGCGYLHFALTVDFPICPIAKLLFDHGVKLNQSLCRHTNTLLLAASNNMIFFIPLLLQHGISVNSLDENNSTALHVACAKGHWEFVKVLIDHSADIFIKNDQGLAAFDIACNQASYFKDNTWNEKQNNLLGLKVLQMFLDRGACVNAQANFGGWTALHCAANGVHMEMTQLLLSNGASAQMRNSYGETPLAFCFPLDRKTLEVADLLLDYGAYGASPKLETTIGTDWRREQPFCTIPA